MSIFDKWNLDYIKKAVVGSSEIPVKGLLIASHCRNVGIDVYRGPTPTKTVFFFRTSLDAKCNHSVLWNEKKRRFEKLWAYNKSEDANPDPQFKTMEQRRDDKAPAKRHVARHMRIVDAFDRRHYVKVKNESTESMCMRYHVPCKAGDWQAQNIHVDCRMREALLHPDSILTELCYNSREAGERLRVWSDLLIADHKNASDSCLDGREVPEILPEMAPRHLAGTIEAVCDAVDSITDLVEQTSEVWKPWPERIRDDPVAHISILAVTGEYVDQLHAGDTDNFGRYPLAVVYSFAISDAGYRFRRMAETEPLSLILQGMKAHWYTPQYRQDLISLNRDQGDKALLITGERWQRIAGKTMVEFVGRMDEIAHLIKAEGDVQSAPGQ